jgi:hypothetical protein
VFVIANGGNPIGTGDRADITFSGNTPYVTWHHNGNVVTGHFTTPDAFVKDGNPLGTSAPDSVRAPISSACTANPFNGDGSVCQGSPIGSPFLLFTDGSSPPPLLAEAYSPDTPVTGTPSSITGTGATISGSVNPEGAPVSVSFNFGSTAAYGQTTSPQTLPGSDASTTFTANITGIAGSTTIHYQAVVKTDFGTFLGGDQSFTTLDTTPPTVSAKLAKSTIKKLLKSKKLKVSVTISEAGSVSLTASTSIKAKHHKHKTVKLGKTKVTFTAAGTRSATIKVPSSGLNALRSLKTGAKIKVTFTGTDTAQNTSRAKTVSAVFKRK